jgi:putative transposase
MMAGVAELAPVTGVAGACRALGVARASFYRRRLRQPDEAPEDRAAKEPAPGAPRSHPRALSAPERQAVLDVLHAPRFVDASPAAVYATLLDDGVYLASERTMYRLLAAAGETRERRAQLAHPAYAKPELLATAPKQVGSWDITKLLGPAKWTYYYLYGILDIYSRYVVGWMVAHREQAALAERLIAETLAKQGIAPGQLIIHADRGSSMTSKPVAFLLADLGVTKTHSRPHVSNDNPYSEAQFKTLKYRPGFPDRFAPTASPRSRKPALSAGISSAGTTPSIATPASGCCRRKWSTTGGLRPPATPALRSWPRLTPLIPSASSTNRPSHRGCRPPLGSTRQRRPQRYRRCLTKLLPLVSQTY